MSTQESEQWRRQAASFGAVADLYDEVRPSYPAEALDWALGPLGSGSWQVADIGAGTGIMTRLLLAAGHRAIAVEPDPQMRRRLAEATPEATVLAGRAEEVPLPDGAVDGAVAAQAYHWFDRPNTHAELARIIRPHGIFAAIWNDRDDSAGWVRDYTRIIEGIRGEDSSAYAGRTAPSFGDQFGPVVLEQFRHAVPTTPERLVRLLQSRSYYLTADPERQAGLAAEVMTLATRHPDLTGRSEFELPYVTSVYRAVRSG